MHMSKLERRAQILFAEDEYRSLEREARERGVSVGALVRDAVTQVYGTERDRRRAAGERLLAAEPMPVDDWAAMKDEMLDDFSALPDER